MTAALLTQAWLAATERVLNGYLRLDPEAVNRLSTLSGKVVAIELAGLDRTLYLLFGPAGLQMRSTLESPADLRLRGTPLALLRLTLNKGSDNKPAATTFTGEVEIDGDTEVAQHFNALIQDMDIDWEELVSKFTGDVLAHKLGNAARATQTWATRRAAVAGQNFTEYQQEEVRNLPAFNEAATFYSEVDELRDDLERMEQRLRRLQARLDKTASAAESPVDIHDSKDEPAPEPHA